MRFYSTPGTRPLEITPNAFDKYDRDLLFQACGVGDSAREAAGLVAQANEMTFKGFRR